MGSDRKVGKHYYIDYRDADGKRSRKSIGKAKAVADQFLKKVEGEVATGKHGLAPNQIALSEFFPQPLRSGQVEPEAIGDRQLSAPYDEQADALRVQTAICRTVSSPDLFDHFHRLVFAVGHRKAALFEHRDHRPVVHRRLRVDPFQLPPFSDFHAVIGEHAP